MMDGKNSEVIGSFEIFEIKDPSFFEKNKNKSRFSEPLGLTVAESAFLLASLERNRFSLVVVADRAKNVRVVVTALYRMFRVIIVFTPNQPFSTADLYSMIELRGTIEISPRALEIIKARSGGIVDYGCRVDRLLNLDYFLARGTERQRCYHDMIDNVNVFAKNVAELCGIKLTLEPEYPEPIFFARFDYALLGALIIEEFVKMQKAEAFRAHIGFLTHRDSEPFADMRFVGVTADTKSIIIRIAERLNMPIRISNSENGVARILFSPVRPDFSVLELKQALTIKPRTPDVAPCDDDKFPK